VTVNLKLVAQLSDFADAWDKNIGEQGYVKEG